MKRTIWTAIILILVILGILGIIIAVHNNTNDVEPISSTVRIPDITTDSAEDLPYSNGSSPVSNPSAGIFEALVKRGYSGTIEEWIASLVGENYPGETETAFQLAKEKGFQGGFDEWMKTVTGHTSTDQSKTAYQIARENGRMESLSEWLSSLVENTDELGHAANEGTTEYERACENGFQGTFIEWLVSLVGLQP